MRLLSLPPICRRLRDAERVPAPLGRGPGRRGLAVAFLVATGCGGYGQPDEDFESTLVVRGACGDLYFFAHDQADEILLEVSLPPVLDQVGPSNLTASYTLPLDEVEIVVSTGKGVSALACNDVVENGGPDVERTWTAVEGTLTLIVAPATDADPVRGTLTMEGVRLEGELQPLEIESFVITNEPLGELPG